MFRIELVSEFPTFALFLGSIQCFTDFIHPWSNVEIKFSRENRGAAAEWFVKAQIGRKFENRVISLPICCFFLLQIKFVKVLDTTFDVPSKR